MNFGELAGDLGLGEEEYLELIALLVATGTADLDKLRSAVEEEDAVQAANAAHSLKGAACSLGLIELQDAAEEIEENARDNHLKGIGGAADELEGMLEEIARISRVGPST